MATQIKLPSMGEGVESGDVLSILVKEGDTIQPDQDLIEIETDKATMPVPASEGGRVTKVLVSQGQTIEVGTPLVEIEAAAAEQSEPDESPPEDEGAEEPAPAQSSESASSAAEPASEEAESTETATAEAEEPHEAVDNDRPATPPEQGAPRRQKAAETEQRSAPSSPATADRLSGLPKIGGETPGDGQSATAASPSVRRLARQLGVDLRRVRPSGAGGRITTEDVTAYVRQTNQRLETTTAPQHELPGEPDADDWGPVRRERMTRLRQTIARNMTASYTTIPQLTNFDDVDVTELEELRRESKDDYARSGIKLTTMPFLTKAVAAALRKHPIVNASVDVETNEIVYKEYINIGIAVDTERGLVVPVLRDVDRMNIPQIASEIARLGELAREGKYSLQDLRGGTFTISNLGAIGGTYSTPIINPPEVAILLTGRTRTLPTYVDGELLPRLVMPLSLTYDHRVVDGAAAARFLNEVKGYLAAPGRLLLAP